MKRTIEERLLNPKAGTAIAEAQEFGIDLTILLRQLRLTPQQRIEELQSEMETVESLKKAKKKDKKAESNG